MFKLDVKHGLNSSNHFEQRGYRRKYHNSGEEDGTTQRHTTSRRRQRGPSVHKKACDFELRLLMKRSVNTTERTRMTPRHRKAQRGEASTIEPAKANLEPLVYAKYMNVDEVQPTVAALYAHFPSIETTNLSSKPQIILGLGSGSRSNRVIPRFWKPIRCDPLRQLLQFIVVLCIFIDPTIAAAIPNATTVNEQSPGWPVGPGWPPFDGWPIVVFAALSILLACWLAKTFKRSPVAGIGMGVCTFIAIYTCGDEDTTATVFWT